ncbi:MAG: hypothetical protein AAF202_10870, partial [Pseudomonadota bacterium]
GPTGVQKGMIAESRGVVRIDPDSEVRQVFASQISSFMNVKIHETGRLRKKNFRAWNRMEASNKNRLLQMLLSHHSVDQMEQIAQQVVPGHETNAFSLKVLQILEAIEQDPNLDVAAKIDFLLNLISNQKVFSFRPVESIIFSSYVMKVLFSVAEKADLGLQHFALRVVEQSPNYWLLAMPFYKGMIDIDDPYLSAARIIGSLAHDTELSGEATEYEGLFREYLPFAQKTEGLGWQYMKLVSEVSRHRPEVAKDFMRYKFMVDQLNMRSLRILGSEHSLRFRQARVRVADRTYDQSEVYPEGTVEKLKGEVRRNRRVVAELIFGGHRYLVQDWLEFVDTTLSFDADRFRSYVERTGLEFEDEVYGYFEAARNPEYWDQVGSTTFIYPILQVFIDSDGSGNVSRKIYFVNYQRSMLREEN